MSTKHQARKGILTLKDAQAAIVRGLHLSQMPLVLGESGAGKSAVIEGITDLIPNSVLRPMSLVSLEAYDFTGIPEAKKYKDTNGNIVDERMGFLSPTMIPLVGDERNPNIIPPGTEMFIIFIDEIPEGDEPTLKALYRVLNERMVQDRKIHPMVRFVGAGNRAQDGANTKQLPQPLNNRMFHITVEVSPKEWVNWAAKNNILPAIRAFILNHPQYLHTYEADSKVSGGCKEAWASPRSWANLNAYLQGNKNVPSLDISDESDLIAQVAATSYVGEAAGRQFIEYALGNCLPPIDTILADQSFDPFQLTPGKQFMLGQSLLDHANGNNIADVLRVLGRMPNDHKAINYTQLPTVVDGSVYADMIKDSAFMEFAELNIELLNMLKKS